MWMSTAFNHGTMGVSSILASRGQYDRTPCVMEAVKLVADGVFLAVKSIALAMEAKKGVLKCRSLVRYCMGACTRIALLWQHNSA